MLNMTDCMSRKLNLAHSIVPIFLIKLVLPIKLIPWLLWLQKLKHVRGMLTPWCISIIRRKMIKKINHLPARLSKMSMINTDKYKLVSSPIPLRELSVKPGIDMNPSFSRYIDGLVTDCSISTANLQVICSPALNHWYLEEHWEHFLRLISSTSTTFSNLVEWTKWHGKIHHGPKMSAFY